MHKKIDDTDKFDAIIREKLNSHQMLVDNKLWNDIQKNITNKKGKKPILIYYWLSAGVAAVIAMLFFINIDNIDKSYQIAKVDIDSMENIEIKKHNSRSNSTDIASTMNNSKIAQTAKNIAHNTTTVAMANRIIPTNKSKLTDSETTSIEQSKNISTNLHSKSELDVKNRESKSIDRDVKNNRNKNNHSQNVIIKPLTSGDLYSSNFNSRNSKKSGLIVAMSVSSKGNINRMSDKSLLSRKNGMVAYSTPLNMARFLNSTITEEVNQPILTPDDYSDQHHYPPLTFELSVSKELFNGWYIESGISYTYLKSDYERSKLFNYVGSLQLHYVGIPLNIRKNIFEGKKWIIYTSAGVKIDKGVYSVYKQKVKNDYINSEIEIGSKIDGFQYSIQGSVGIETEILKSVSIYAEPKIKYYFNNNQPISAYTLEPTFFGLSAGFRLKL